MNSSSCRRLQVEHEELPARPRAISRHRPDCSGRLQIGALPLGPERQRAWRAETELDLSRREFDVLRVLMENTGRVVSRLQLLDEVWDDETDLRSKAIDVHVSQVRAMVDRAFDVRRSRPCADAATA
ncbi:MAG: winged helix-turn-helix transcriptional regulator [Streptomyces sp.]|nr:winged helix-turn-helix transcriptional regulator [Streptomyces sp.]